MCPVSNDNIHEALEEQDELVAQAPELPVCDEDDAATDTISDNIEVGTPAVLDEEDDEADEMKDPATTDAVCTPDAATRRIILTSRPVVIYRCPNEKTPMGRARGPFCVTGPEAAGFLPVNCIISGHRRVDCYIRSR